MLADIGFGKSAGLEIGPELVEVVELDQIGHKYTVVLIVGLAEML